MSVAMPAKYRGLLTFAYVSLFLALFTGVFGVFAYLLAWKLSKTETLDLWVMTHSIWIMQHVLMFLCLASFAGLWFIPLAFVPWDFAIWSKATTVIGVIFAGIAWLFLLNAWIKGLGKCIFRKAVF